MNYAVFSVFASLLITEVVGSVMLLVFWERTKSKVLEYIVPVWEVTGTFGAFWVVTSYFAYPALLIPAASIFAPLLIVFLILFVLRNSSIVFGEFITKRGWLDEKKLFTAYAISTLLLGVVVLVLLSSLFSGAGVDLSTGSYSLSGWVLSAGSIPFVLGSLLIGLGLGPVFYSVDSLKRAVLPLTAVGVAASVGSFYLYLGASLGWWVAVPVLLTALTAVLYLIKGTDRVVTNKAVFVAVLATIIFSLQSLVYPSVLGGEVSVDSVTTAGPMASAFVTITMVGGALLAAMLALYMAVIRRRPDDRAVAGPISRS